MISAKEIAERYAGRIVKCKLSNLSDPKSPVTDAAGNQLVSYEARIVGWKKSQGGLLSFSYVCVELVGGAVSKTPLSKFNLGYTYTYDKNPNGFGKKLLPEEIELPPDAGKDYTPKPKIIPEWPHTCRDCGSPAQILGLNIDCSNATCKHKYRTHSGLDLFLPREIREALAAKSSAHPMWSLDRDGVLTCRTCKDNLQIPQTILWDSPGVLNMVCHNKHTAKVKLAKGDKIKDRTGRVTTYDGKRFVV